MKIQLASLLFLSACGSSAPKTSTPTPASSGTTLAAQIETGKQLYGAKCASCHGDGGQGTDKGPPVVGKDAFPLAPRPDSKRDATFKTAADVFAWTVQHMPADAPGTLSTDEYLAIFAFDLTANGIKLEAPLDGAAAGAIVLHP